MRPLPTNHLDPRMRTVWRATSALRILIVLLCVLVGIAFPIYAVGGGSLPLALVVALVVLFGIDLVVQAFIVPGMRYDRWLFEVGENELDISQGIIWRKRTIIPFVRVQNTDTRQGPILRAFGLASVTVATAAKEHEIPGLQFDVAEQLRDRAAELARLAREDV